MPALGHHPAACLGTLTLIPQVLGLCLLMDHARHPSGHCPQLKGAALSKVSTFSGQLASGDWPMGGSKVQSPASVWDISKGLSQLLQDWQGLCCHCLAGEHFPLPNLLLLFSHSCAQGELSPGTPDAIPPGPGSGWGALPSHTGLKSSFHAVLRG